MEQKWHGQMGCRLQDCLCPAQRDDCPGKMLVSLNINVHITLPTIQQQPYLRPVSKEKQHIPQLVN